MTLNNDLDEIIEREYKKAFEILEEIIEYIKRKYGIDYKIPELEISRGRHSFAAGYSKSENKIIFFKETIKMAINNYLKYLSYKEKNKRSIDKLLKRLDYKKIIGSRQNSIKYLEYTEFFEGKINLFKKYIEVVNKLLKSLGYEEIKGIEYLNRSHNSILLFPFYVNKRNIREAIAEVIIFLAIFHEIWHSIDDSILDKLKEDPTIKDRDYLIAILNNLNNRELRASAFEVVMYYLVNGLDKDAKGYMAAYVNVLTCRKYIEKIDIMKRNIYMNIRVPFDLGRCYGNIIVAKYKSSLKENIYKIIDDIIYLDEKRTIDEIKHYVYNPDKLLHNRI
jgi:hypothetical protein